jgi:hypothetical protein
MSETSTVVMRELAQTRRGGTAENTRIGRVDVVEPGHDVLCLSMQSERSLA